MISYPQRYRPSRTSVMAAVIFALFLLVSFADGDINALGARPGSCPQYEHALAARGLPVAFFSQHMYQESRCNPEALNINDRTRDLSFGLTGLNLYEPATRAWYVEHGFGYWNLTTVDGNLNGAVLLYNQCSTKPWVKPYGCTAPKVKAVMR